MNETDSRGILENLFGDDAQFILRYGSEAILREGRAFFWQDDSVDRCALILDGRILPVKHRLGASDIVLPPLVRGDWIALAELTALSAAQADYIADRDTGYVAFTARNYAAIRERISVERKLALALARSTLSLHSWLQEGGSLERTLAWILSRRKKTATMENSSIVVTQAQLARYLGLTRETVNKRLNQLEEEGLIRTRRGVLEIPDWEQISEYVDSLARY